MQNDPYLLSVVIPTRNRQPYAVACVQQVYAVTDDAVQIVVQDNSDDDSLRAALAAFAKEPRVKYHYSPKRLPGVENYGMGVELSDGEYVCCIGDDDGVMACITDVVRLAHERGIRAVKPSMQAVYFWPDASERFREGCAFLETYSEAAYIFPPQQGVEKLIQNGFQGYLNTDVVKAYHGIVKRSCFARVRERTGRWCGGLSPDIYWSVSLSLLIDRAVAIDFPLTISGACRVSSTGEAINRLSVGPLSSAPHLIGQAYTWTDRIPAMYCDETIWADSAVHALEDMGASALLENFGAERLLAACIQKCMLYGKYRAFKPALLDFYRRFCPAAAYRRLEARGAAPVLRRRAKDLVIKAFPKLVNVKGNKKRGIRDVAEAERYYRACIPDEAVETVMAHMAACAQQGENAI